MQKIFIVPAMQNGCRAKPLWVDRDMQPGFTVYFFDIGHPCYDQLTPVKIRYLLTIIT